MCVAVCVSMDTCVWVFWISRRIENLLLLLDKFPRLPASGIVWSSLPFLVTGSTTPVRNRREVLATCDTAATRHTKSQSAFYGGRRQDFASEGGLGLV